MFVNVLDPTLHEFNMCFLNLDLDLGGTVFTKITNLLVFFPNLRLILSSCTAVSGNVYYILIVKFTLVDLLCMSLDVDPHSNPHGIRNRNRKIAACNVQCAIDSADGCCYRDRNAWNTFPGSEYRKII
jgi:hypothetical protein